MRSPSSLLLGACVCCGEPIFRHRTADNRQISCDDVRRLDEPLKAPGAATQQPRRDFHLVTSVRDRDGQGGVR